MSAAQRAGTMVLQGPAGHPVEAMTQQQQSAAEFTHLAVTFGDCIEALPPSITRSISDLRELDAVLSGSLALITEKLDGLLNMLEDTSPSTTPAQRFALLREIAEEARSFRLGGEDKIRVATGTCETLSHHTTQLDILANLLTTLLPASMAGTVPPPTWPHGYPVLFPTPASASGSAYRRPDYLPNALVHGKHTALHGNIAAHSLDSYATRSANVYHAAAESVRGYLREGVALPNQELIQAQIAAAQAGPPPPPPGITASSSGAHAQHHHHHHHHHAGTSASGAKRSRTTTKDSSAGTGRTKGGRASNSASTAAAAQQPAAASSSSMQLNNGKGLDDEPAPGGLAAATFPVNNSMSSGTQAAPNPLAGSSSIPMIGPGAGSNPSAVGLSRDASRSRIGIGGADDEPSSGFIPYANSARGRASLDAVAENAAHFNSSASTEAGAAGSQHHHHHHHHHHAKEGGASKKRRASKQHSMSEDQNGHDMPGGDEEQPTAHKRERQNSGRASAPLQSPVVASASTGNGSKRSRQTSKRGIDNTSEPGSPYLAHPGLNGNGKGASVSGADPHGKPYDSLGVPSMAHTHLDRNKPNREHNAAASEVDPQEGEYEGEGELDGDGPEDGDGEGGDGDERTYCYCDRVSFGDMIGCDGEDCKREWFHLQCVGMDDPPKGEWYCDDCVAMRQAMGIVPTKKRRT